MANLRRLLRWALLAPVVLLVACGGAKDIKIGAVAPDFSLTSAAGETVSLAHFKGQPVLLYFHMAVG
jgi:cytochrome oxidase Cu insertion factor (SCO1/SenC/PrrC family)